MSDAYTAGGDALGTDQGPHTATDDDPGVHLTDLVQQEQRSEPMLNNNVRGQEGSKEPWYHFNDGERILEGKGDMPEWFNSKTFKSIEEQAKAHPELRKLYNDKFKGKSGAPKDGYTYDLSQEMVDKNYKFDSSNSHYQDFLDLSEQNELSQDLVEKMTDLYIESTNKGMDAQKENYQKYQDEQFHQLSPEEKNGFETAIKHAANNPDVDTADLNVLLEDLTTAAGIRAFTRLINTDNYSNLPGPEVSRSKDSYHRQNELRDKLQSIQHLRGHAKEAAKKSLRGEYEDEYGDGYRTFG